MLVERRAYSHLHPPTHASLDHTNLPFDGFLPPWHYTHIVHAGAVLLMDRHEYRHPVVVSPLLEVSSVENPASDCPLASYLHASSGRSWHRHQCRLLRPSSGHAARQHLYLAHVRWQDPNQAGWKGGPSGEPSGVSAEEQGPTARTLQGAVQLTASLALSTLASMLAFTPWRTMEAELYTHAQPPTTNLGAGRSASARVEVRRLTRENARCLRTMSFARYCRSVTKSQQARWSPVSYTHLTLPTKA